MLAWGNVVDVHQGEDDPDDQDMHRNISLIVMFVMLCSVDIHADLRR